MRRHVCVDGACQVNRAGGVHQAAAGLLAVQRGAHKVRLMHGRQTPLGFFVRNIQFPCQRCAISIPHYPSPFGPGHQYRSCEHTRGKIYHVYHMLVNTQHSLHRRRGLVSGTQDDINRTPRSPRLSPRRANDSTALSHAPRSQRYPAARPFFVILI